MRFQIKYNGELTEGYVAQKMENGLLKIHLPYEHEYVILGPSDLREISNWEIAKVMAGFKESYERGDPYSGMQFNLLNKMLELGYTPLEPLHDFDAITVSAAMYKLMQEGYTKVL